MRVASSLLLIGALLAAGRCTPEPKSAYTCPNWSSNSIHNYENTDFSNFSCAYYNNVRAQVADPADLNRGQGQSIQNGDRESVNVQKYLTATQQNVTSPSTQSSSGSSASTR